MSEYGLTRTSIGPSIVACWCISGYMLCEITLVAAARWRDGFCSFVRFGIMFGWLPAEPFIGRPSSRALSSAALAATHWRWSGRSKDGKLSIQRKSEREGANWQGRSDQNITGFCFLSNFNDSKHFLSLIGQKCSRKYKKVLAQNKAADRGRQRRSSAYLVGQDANGILFFSADFGFFHPCWRRCSAI